MSKSAQNISRYRRPPGLAMTGIGVLLITVLGIAIAAGVSEDLDGTVEGEAAIIVEQALAVTTGEIRLVDKRNRNDPQLVNAPDSSFVIGDGGIAFLYSVSVHTGDEYAVNLGVSNGSGEFAQALLEANIPDQFTAVVDRLQIFSDGSPIPANLQDVINVSPLDHNVWLIEVQALAKGDFPTLQVRVQVSHSTQPGQFDLAFTLSPFAL